MTEREIARRATCAAFAKRACGMSPNAENNQYHGEFDYLSVVNAAPVPNPGEHKHSWHWSELFRIFDEEWRKFA